MQVKQNAVKNKQRQRNVAGESLAASGGQTMSQFMTHREGESNSLCNMNVVDYFMMQSVIPGKRWGHCPLEGQFVGRPEMGWSFSN